jgi:hypothetical protein
MLGKSSIMPVDCCLWIQAKDGSPVWQISDTGDRRKG